MRRFIASCAAALVAALIALAVVPLSVAPEAVRDAVAERLEALTGHQVEIAGATKLHRFPYLRFAIEDIRLRTSGHGSDGELARIGRLTGSIAMLPMFVGRIDTSGITLVRPQLSLAVDGHGRGNWQSETGLAAKAMLQPDSFPTREVRIGDVRVEEGSIRFVDRRSGETVDVDSIRATLSWPDLAAPLSGTGSLVWRDDPVEFNFRAKEPFSFLRRGSSAARLSLSSPFASISFSGDAHLTDNTHLRGRIALTTESARRFLRRLGSDFGTGAGLDAMELSGQISLLGNTAIISALSLTLDGNEAEGSLKVDIEKDRIGLQGTLAFETLNLNRYRMVDLEAEGALPRDFMATPIDLSDLRRVEADIRISAEQVAFGELTLGNTAGTATVRDGALTLGLAQAAVYGGGGLGTITVTPHDAGVSTRVNANWEHISMADFLESVGMGGRLEGAARGWAKLTGRGSTLGEILAELSGEAAIVVTDGMLIGVDVATLVEAVGARRLAGWPAGERARTPFDRLDTSLRIVDGVATTEDLRLTGPDVDVAVMADVRLAAASVDGRGDALLAGHAGSGDAMPFTIDGPISAPRLRVDRGWLVESARQSTASGEGTGGTVPDELFDRVLDQIPALSR